MLNSTVQFSVSSSRRYFLGRQNALRARSSGWLRKQRICTQRCRRSSSNRGGSIERLSSVSLAQKQAEDFQQLGVVVIVAENPIFAELGNLAAMVLGEVRERSPHGRGQRQSRVGKNHACANRLVTFGTFAAADIVNQCRGKEDRFRSAGQAVQVFGEIEQGRSDLRDAAFVVGFAQVTPGPRIQRNMQRVGGCERRKIGRRPGNCCAIHRLPSLRIRRLTAVRHER